MIASNPVLHQSAIVPKARQQRLFALGSNCDYSWGRIRRFGYRNVLVRSKSTIGTRENWYSPLPAGLKTTSCLRGQA